MAQLARRIAAEEIALHDAGIDHPAPARAHALVIEGGAGLAARGQRVLIDIQVIGKHCCAHAVEQEARPPVQRTAAERLHQRAQ